MLSNQDMPKVNELYITSLLSLANMLVTSLVFGQALLEKPFDSTIGIGAVILFALLYCVSYLMRNVGLRRPRTI